MWVWWHLHVVSVLGKSIRRITKVQGHPQLHREFETSLGSMKPCVKRKNKQIGFVASSGEQSKPTEALMLAGVLKVEKAQWSIVHLTCHNSCPCTWLCSSASVGWWNLLSSWQKKEGATGQPTDLCLETSGCRSGVWGHCFVVSGGGASFCW